MNFEQQSMNNNMMEMNIQQQPFQQQVPPQQPNGMTPQAPAPSLFGVVIPGKPVRTDFVPVDSSGLKYTMVIRDVVDPASVISDLVFFLLTPHDFPATHGAILYAAIQQQQQQAMTNSEPTFELLGAVSQERPSGIFRTKWTNNTTTTTTTTGITAGAAVVTLGISIETSSHIQNLDLASKGAKDQGTVDVAKKIALNLFNFLQSFDDCNNNNRTGNGLMTVPVNVFERWIQKFQNKYRVDPHFFLKED